MTDPETIEELRETCAAQTKLIMAQAGEIAELRATVAFLKEQHNLGIHRQFGRSSEQAPAGQEAFVFNEAETFADPTEPEPPVEKVVAPRKARKPGQRREKVAHLETREVEHPATEEQQTCTCCGEKMHPVDWQIRQEVEYIPAQAILVSHKQPVYACRSCQEAGEPAPIQVIKTMPEPAFPKSLASPSLVSHIITQKFVMGAPLYRQEQNMEGLGVLFSRQTMANWMIRAGALMQPVHDRLHQILVSLDIIHADETKVQVLKEAGRAASTDSTMWVYRSGRDEPPIVLYDYQTTRAGKHACQFLEGFGGYDPKLRVITRKKYLNVDGHEGYDAVPLTVIIDGKKTPDVTLAGCWAHARRKFHDAAKVVKKEDRKPGKRIAADEGLKLCNDLYHLESEFKDMPHDDRYAARLNRSAAKIAEIKAWLDKAAIEVLPKTATGEAVAYCLNQWTKLTAFLLDGRLEIDNNRAERAVKPFVIGRKNWLFANTPAGVKSSAVLYSIVETAKANGLIPFEYVKYVLEQLPNINVNNTEAVDKVLPWSLDVPERCHSRRS